MDPSFQRLSKRAQWNMPWPAIVEDIVFWDTTKSGISQRSCWLKYAPTWELSLNCSPSLERPWNCAQQTGKTKPDWTSQHKDSGYKGGRMPFWCKGFQPPCAQQPPYLPKCLLQETWEGEAKSIWSESARDWACHIHPPCFLSHRRHGPSSLSVLRKIGRPHQWEAAAIIQHDDGMDPLLP